MKRSAPTYSAAMKVGSSLNKLPTNHTSNNRNMASKTNTKKRFLTKKGQVSHGELVQNHSVRLMIQKDPPPIRNQTREIRRIRIAPLANIGFSPVPSTIAANFGTGSAVEAFRILRVSAYATDEQVGGTAGTSSRGVTLSLPGIQAVGSTGSISLGDGAIFTDVGTTGSSRAQVHAIPSREFEQHWWLCTDPVSVPVTVASVPLAASTSTAVNLLDLTVELLYKP